MSYRAQLKYLIAMSAVVTFVLPGCKSKPKAAPAPAPAPVKKVAPKPKKDPLKKARTDADKRASDTALALGDQARYMAAAVQGSHHRHYAVHVHNEKLGGTIDTTKVRRVFADNQGAFRKCYERALKRNPNLAGQVDLVVQIQSSGKVGTARAMGITLRDAEINRCMVQHVRTMKFPRPHGGAVRLRKPFTFRADL